MSFPDWETRCDIWLHFIGSYPELPQRAIALSEFCEAILKRSFENATDEPGESEPKSVPTAVQVAYYKWATSCVSNKKGIHATVFDSPVLAVAWSYLFALKLTQGRTFAGRILSVCEFEHGATGDLVLLQDDEINQVPLCSLQTIIDEVHGYNWLRRVFVNYRDTQKIHLLTSDKSLPKGLQIFRESPQLF